MTPDPTTDYAARIKAGLVDCNVYAESADCPCCDAQDALASLEAELAEARNAMQAAYDAAGDQAALAEYEFNRAEQAEAALRELDDKWYPMLASRAIGERELGHVESAERWEEFCRDWRAALAVSSASEAETELPGDELPGAQAGTALQVPDTKGVAASASSRSVSASEPGGDGMSGTESPGDARYLKGGSCHA